MDNLALQQIKKIVNIYHRKHYKVKGFWPLFDILGMNNFTRYFSVLLKKGNTIQE